MNTTIQIPEPSRPFNLHHAMSWWKANAGDVRSGTFNMSLFMRLMDFKSDPEKVRSYYERKEAKNV